MIQSVHQIHAEHDQGNWERMLTGSMKGELNRGIGLQVQRLTQQAMETGMSAAVDTWSKEQDGLTRAELEGMTDLTPDQERTLSEIKGREYAELDSRARAGKELSGEERGKLETYQQRDGTARAQQKAEYDAYIQSKVDAHHADAEQTTGAAIAKEKAIAEAQRRAAEAAARNITCCGQWEGTGGGGFFECYRTYTSTRRG
ncbi:MAG: hypothetical protein Q8R43_01430 [Alphaproteobacteria bacterium]|nr:hypothetical protein [Alphaproteobacteria bacterium]